MPISGRYGLGKPSEPGCHSPNHTLSDVTQPHLHFGVARAAPGCHAIGRVALAVPVPAEVAATSSSVAAAARAVAARPRSRSCGLHRRAEVVRSNTSCRRRARDQRTSAGSRNNDLVQERRAGPMSSSTALPCFEAALFPPGNAAAEAGSPSVTSHLQRTEHQALPSRIAVAPGHMSSVQLPGLMSAPREQPGISSSTLLPKVHAAGWPCTPARSITRSIPTVYTPCFPHRIIHWRPTIVRVRSFSVSSFRSHTLTQPETRSVCCNRRACLFF